MTEPKIPERKIARIEYANTPEGRPSATVILDDGSSLGGLIDVTANVSVDSPITAELTVYVAL